jgi:hypothetical protein
MRIARGAANMHQFGQKFGAALKNYITIATGHLPKQQFQIQMPYKKRTPILSFFLKVSTVAPIKR